MGPISFYISLKVEQNQANRTIKFLELAYANKILFRFYLNQAHKINTLINKTVIFQSQIRCQATVAKKKQYLNMIGIYSSQEKLLVKQYSDSDWVGGKKVENQTPISFLCIIEG